MTHKVKVIIPDESIMKSHGFARLCCFNVAIIECLAKKLRIAASPLPFKD